MEAQRESEGRESRGSEAENAGGRGRAGTWLPCEKHPPPTYIRIRLFYHPQRTVIGGLNALEYFLIGLLTAAKRLASKPHGIDATRRKVASMCHCYHSS